MGTVAYDEIETPKEHSGKILGGAATYIGLSSALFRLSSINYFMSLEEILSKEYLELLNQRD